MVQIGQSQTLSFLGMLLVRFLAFLVSLTQKGRESPMSLQAGRDRIPLPAIRVASYGETFHFGGALQTDDSLPKNYVAMSTSFTPKRMPNLLAKLMFKNVNDRISERVLDFTLVLEGEQEDELPERALCTTRMVRVDTDAVAVLPLGYEEDKATLIESTEESNLPPESLQLWTQRVATEFVTAVRSNLTMPGWQKHSGEIMPDHPSTTSNETSPKNDQSSITTKRTDMINTAINEMLALLEGTNVPVKSDSIYAKFALRDDMMESSIVVPEGMVLVPVKNMVTRDELKLFAISTYCNVKRAVLRIVQTAAWRGRTFPIDIRSCRIELQSGQFFHQGNDRTGHPVFYFTTMCRGPWRRNADATLSAGLHRFETMMRNISLTKQEARCTIVILLGRPKVVNKSKESRTKASDEESIGTQEDTGENGTTVQSVEGNESGNKTTETCNILSNPRVSLEEPWQLHSTRELVEGFLSSVLLHYPQRTHMVLLVKGQGPNIFYKTKVAAIRAMNRTVDISDISAGLKFLSSASKLKNYIDESQLPGVVGGPATVIKDAFEYA